MASTVAPRPRASLSYVVIGLVAVAAIIAAGVTLIHLGGPSSRASFLPAGRRVPSTSVTLHAVTAGRVTGWELPAPLLGPRDVAVGPDGAIWVTEQNRGTVASISGGTLTQYDTRLFQNAGAFSFAPGPGGTLWFSGYPGGSIGRILPDHRMNVFASLAPNAATTGLARGTGGTMWVTDSFRGLLLRISANGTFAQIPVPSDGRHPPGPLSIARAADGTMWFTDPSSGSVGRVVGGSTPSITEYPIGNGAHPRSISAGADGSLWVTLTNVHALASIDPRSGTATVVPIRGVDGTLNDVVVAPDGTLWISETGNSILHVRPDGNTIDRFRLPGGATYADGMALAGDGTLWAAGSDANMVVSIAP